MRGYRLSVRSRVEGRLDSVSRRMVPDWRARRPGPAGPRGWVASSTVVYESDDPVPGVSLPSDGRCRVILRDRPKSLEQRNQRDDHCPRYRPACCVGDRLTSASPDVLRELFALFIHTLMGAGSGCPVWAGLRSAQQRAHQLPQRLSAPPIRHPHRHIGSGDPQAADRIVFPGLAARTRQTR